MPQENYYNGNNSAHGSNSPNDDDYDFDNKYSKQSNIYKGGMNVQAFIVWRILPCVVLTLLPWVPNLFFLRSEMRLKKLALETIIKEQKDIVESLDETTESIKELKRDVEFLNKDNELSFQELKRNGKSPENLAAGGVGGDKAYGGGTIADMESEEYQALEEEEELLVERIDQLEKHIQQSAIKRLSESRYGYGQYRFKVNVRDQQDRLSYFVIETAMLAEMPHAIDHFFKMIEKKLWDGLSLVHEPRSHIISAEPVMADETHAWARQRFVDAELTHMAFTEHSPTYPPPHHRKYTVAFSGRPGGPGFYISLDNELDYAHEHESTFGVVMEGRDVLYQLFLQKETGTRRVLKIESIDVLQTKNPKEDPATTDSNTTSSR